MQKLGLSVLEKNVPAVPAVPADAWNTSKTERWIESSEYHYNELFGALPPAAIGNRWFACGEPMDHWIVDGKEYPVYTVFIEIKGRFFNRLCSTHELQELKGRVEHSFVSEIVNQFSEKGGE